jgi:heat shock protein HslJ
MLIRSFCVNVDYSVWRIDMEHSIRNLAIISLVFAFFALSASAQTLPEGEWHLSSFGFTHKFVFPIDKDQVTLKVHPDGKLGGNTGCNVYGGNYEINDAKLRIFDLISTMRACEEPSSRFEQSFLDTLSGASEVHLEQGELTITDLKTGNFLRFAKAKIQKPRLH